MVCAAACLAVVWCRPDPGEAPGAETLRFGRSQARESITQSFDHRCARYFATHCPAPRPRRPARSDLCDNSGPRGTQMSHASPKIGGRRTRGGWRVGKCRCEAAGGAGFEAIRRSDSKRLCGMWGSRSWLRRRIETGEWTRLHPGYDAGPDPSHGPPGRRGDARLDAVIATARRTCRRRCQNSTHG